MQRTRRQSKLIQISSLIACNCNAAPGGLGSFRGRIEGQFPLLLGRLPAHFFTSHLIGYYTLCRLILSSIGADIPPRPVLHKYIIGYGSERQTVFGARVSFFSSGSSTFFFYPSLSIMISLLRRCNDYDDSSIFFHSHSPLLTSIILCCILYVIYTRYIPRAFVYWCS